MSRAVPWEENTLISKIKLAYRSLKFRNLRKRNKELLQHQHQNTEGLVLYDEPLKSNPTKLEGSEG